MGKVKNSGKPSKSSAENSSTTTKSAGVLTKSVNIKRKSKREKFSQKRNNLRLRLASATPGVSRKTKKRRRKPKQKASVDIKSLKDALPSLEALVKFRSAEIKTGVPEYDNKTEPSKRFKKLSRKAQKMKKISNTNCKNVARMNQLESLMQDRMFKQNPRQIIAEHVKNTRKLEDEMED